MRLRYLILLSALTLGSAAMAQGLEPDHVRRAVQAGKIKPLSEILSRIQKSHGGRVLDVDLERSSGGRQWYEITLLTKDGQRLELYVDAVSGQDITNPRQQTSRTLSMADVVRKVQSAHSGTIREIELDEGQQARLVYVVTLRLSGGRDQRVLVDAVSGQTIAGDPNDGAPPSGAVPLHELVDSIERRTQGRAAQLERKVSLKGRPYYELELQLPDGRGLEIHVDPVSGQILREEDLE